MYLTSRRVTVLLSGVLLAAGLPSGSAVGAADPVERSTGVTTRVSVADDRAQADEKSGEPTISGDGRYVAFVSRASNLVPGDTNDALDVFVHDRETGTTRTVSVSSDGVQGSGPSTEPSISSDGRFVAFTSEASNLVPGDTNDALDVFVRDLQTGTTERVSLDDDSTQLDRPSDNPRISGNGRFVVFRKFRSALPQGASKAFVRDREAGRTEPLPGAGPISDSGRFVAIWTYRRLTSDDKDSSGDVFVHDRRTGTTRLASTRGRDVRPAISLSGDGRFVAYTARLRPTTPPSDLQVYVRDMRSGTVVLASVNGRGVPGNSDSDKPSLSRDGRYVAFWSWSDNLDPRTGERGRIYGHDLRTGVTQTISVSTSGDSADRRTHANAPVPVVDVSATGRVVAFTSPATNLVPRDTNGWADIFVRDRRPR